MIHFFKQAYEAHAAVTTMAVTPLLSVHLPGEGREPAPGPSLATVICGGLSAVGPAGYEDGRPLKSQPRPPPLPGCTTLGKLLSGPQFSHL